MPPLLPRFYGAQQAIEDERRLAKIILETGGSIDEVEGSKQSSRLTKGADGHDWRRRRGLPIVGKGVSGAMPGTNPREGEQATAVSGGTPRSGVPCHAGVTRNRRTPRNPGERFGSTERVRVAERYPGEAPAHFPSQVSWVRVPSSA